jgi:hypothetical protein
VSAMMVLTTPEPCEGCSSAGAVCVGCSCMSPEGEIV